MSKWSLSPSFSGKHWGFFSAIYCGNLVKLMKVNLTIFYFFLPERGSPGVLNSQNYPHWASGISQLSSDFLTLVVSTHESLLQSAVTPCTHRIFSLGGRGLTVSSPLIWIQEELIVFQSAHLLLVVKLKGRLSNSLHAEPKTGSLLNLLNYFLKLTVQCTKNRFSRYGFCVHF